MQFPQKPKAFAAAMGRTPMSPVHDGLVAKTMVEAAGGARLGLLRRLGFAKAEHPVAFFPMAGAFQQCQPLKPFQNIALRPGCGGGAQTAMLRHDKR